jgi:chitosanase
MRPNIDHQVRLIIGTSHMRASRRDFLLGSCGAAIGLATSIEVAHSAQTMDMIAREAQEAARAMPRLSDPMDELAARIKAISNVFEVGSPAPEYGYVEKLGDGRGYTVTNYGFCTSTGEVAALINLYAAAVPATPLKRFIDSMPPAREQDGDLDDFPDAWRAAIGSSDRLAGVCDKEADRLYFAPAMAAANAAGMHSPIGKLIFYDTWLQHGAGDDPDSFNAIYARAAKKVGGGPPFAEHEFLETFLAIRKAVLQAPFDPATRKVWRQSAPRVDALTNLLERNPNLAPPVTVANAEVHAIIG